MTIYKELANAISSGESSKVELAVDVKTGESKLIIKKTIIERYPTKDYKKVMQLHKDLNREE